MEDESQKQAQALESADKTIATEAPAPIAPENIDGAVRTYATDIAEMMKKQKGSIIKIALAEQERRNELKRNSNPTATKNIVVVMLGFIFIVGGIMIFIYTIVNRDKPVDVVATNTVFPSLLFTENQVQIDMTNLNKTELFNSIKVQTANRTLVPETINNLYISYKTPSGQIQVPATVFLQKLGIDTPDNLLQNLFPQFMLGIYSMEPRNNEFLIFKVKDFDSTFLAMRDWETSMLSDLLRLFEINTSSEGKAIFSKDFETITLYNKEARVLKDSTDKILISYIFLDQKTVMVTTETHAVQEVLKRLNLQNIK